MLIRRYKLKTEEDKKIAEVKTKESSKNNKDGGKK